MAQWKGRAPGLAVLTQWSWALADNDKLSCNWLGAMSETRAQHWGWLMQRHVPMGARAAAGRTRDAEAARGDVRLGAKTPAGGVGRSGVPGVEAGPEEGPGTRPGEGEDDLPAARKTFEGWASIRIQSVWVWCQCAPTGPCRVSVKSLSTRKLDRVYREFLKHASKRLP